MKTVKERDNIDLLELVCQLHSRSLMYRTKELHDAWFEARTELESRLKPCTETPCVLGKFIAAIRKEFPDQNWDYLDSIAERVLGDCTTAGAVESDAVDFITWYSKQMNTEECREVLERKSYKQAYAIFKAESK